MNEQNVLAHVGSNIRRLRDDAGLSQQALADAAGVSRRTIAALEGGEANISLAKLSLIATALGVPFVELVTPLGRPAGNILTWRGRHPQSEAVLRAAINGRSQVELWSWSLAPGERYQAEADPPGWQEILYVIEGVLTLEQGGSTSTLQAEDSMILDSSVAYTYSNHGDALLRFVRNIVG